MNYGEIRYRVSKEAPGVDLDLLDGYLLDRYTSILDRLKWTRQLATATINTVAGTAVYALPATMKIFGSASMPAESIDLQKMTRAELNESAPGRPAGDGPPRIVAFSFDSSATPPTLQIELYPSPDAVYAVAVEGTAEAPTVTGTGMALLPWLRPSALVAGASADALGHLEEFTAADRQELKYETYLADMIRTEGLNRGPQPLKMSPWLTRHNLIRAMRSSTRTGPKLP